MRATQQAVLSAHGDDTTHLAILASLPVLPSDEHHPRQVVCPLRVVSKSKAQVRRCTPLYARNARLVCARSLWVCASSPRLGSTVRRPFRPVLKVPYHTYTQHARAPLSCLHGWPSSPLQQQRVCVCVGRVAGACAWSETRCQLTQLT
jgi:hypothetical protein